MSSASLERRIARLEARLTGPDPELLDRVATLLDRVGTTDPEQANELLATFGLRPCYPPLPPFRKDSTDA